MKLRELYDVYDGAMYVNIVDNTNTMVGRLSRISSVTFDHFTNLAHAKVLYCESDDNGMTVKVEIE